MSGKVAVVTGTTSGTGFVCARELGKKGATVVVLNRKSERSEKSLKELEKTGTFEAVECDLQSFESVKGAAAKICAKFEKVDVLVNNAGVMALKDYGTSDNYDVQMQTNVLSHFLLTKLLFPLLLKAPEGRIVNHTSAARLGPPLEKKYFQAKGGDLGGDGTEEESLSFKGPRWARYHQTKLANCCFTYALKEKLAAAGISTIVPLLAHPGLALTQLQATTAADGGMHKESPLMNDAQSAEDGACGILRCAMDSDAKAGDFFGPTPDWKKGFPDPIDPEPLLSDATNLSIFWTGCEAAVGPFPISSSSS